MPKKCHPSSPNLVRHLFEKDASCPGTGQAAILDLQDQLRGPRPTPVTGSYLYAYMPLHEHVLSMSNSNSNTLCHSGVFFYYTLNTGFVQKKHESCVANIVDLFTQPAPLCSSTFKLAHLMAEIMVTTELLVL